MRNVRFGASLVQQFLDLARRILPRQGKLIFRLFTEFIDLLQIFSGAHRQNLFDVQIGETLSIRHQIQGGQQTFDVPRERTTVTFVEVVDIKIDNAAAIQIGTEVFSMQIALINQKIRRM